MVLESLTNPFLAEKKAMKLFGYGFLYVSIALLLSYQVFKSYASLITVFLTVAACIPLFYHTMKY